MSPKHLSLALFVSTLVLTGCAAQDRASGVDEQVRIPTTMRVSTQPGETVIVYGQRKPGCKGGVPTFEWMLSNAVTSGPEHGTLSNGGVGKRSSGSCGKVVPVRAVAYTPEAGFTGTDTVTFWEQETVTVEVKP